MKLFKTAIVLLGLSIATTACGDKLPEGTCEYYKSKLIEVAPDIKIIQTKGPHDACRFQAGNTATGGMLDVQIPYPDDYAVERIYQTRIADAMNNPNGKITGKWGNQLDMIIKAPIRTVLRTKRSKYVIIQLTSKQSEPSEKMTMIFEALDLINLYWVLHSEAL